MRNVTDNFHLESTSFLSGGTLDENGRCNVTKRFLYSIVDNSAAARNRAVLDLETLVPLKGSCMSDDPRYTLKSASWNCLDWEKQSTKFLIDANYQRVSDDDAASAPWNLAPFNISPNAVEQEIPFTMAYNQQNQLCIPVVNSAGDPIDATTKEVLMQYAFSFYAENYDMANIIEFSNSVNNTAQRILGQRYPAGTLFLMPFNVTCLVTYEDDGYTEKWKYFQVDMTIRHREQGWRRELLNVGNRARFNGNNCPEEIYQYYPFNYSLNTFKTTPVWTDAVTYHSCDSSYQTYLAANPTEAQNLPPHIPYEFGTNIPQTDTGEVNTAVLHTDITSPAYSGYPTRKFNEFKTLNWSGLDLPSEIKKRWRV